MSSRSGGMRSFDAGMPVPPGDSPAASGSGGRLALVPIGPDAWRLCDRHARRDDAAHVLAYLERAGAGFDVIWLRGADLPRQVGSLAEALSLAERLLRESEPHGPSRPVPIAHFAPTTGTLPIDELRGAVEASRQHLEGPLTRA